MKNAKPLFFILGIVLIIWPVNYFIHGMQRPSPHAEKLNRVVQGDEFLMGLNNRPGDGCVALKYIKDVDIVVIGSSHAYASIDPYVLKNKLGNKRVALCTVPTWNTDFLHPFMKFLTKENVPPKRIIWIADAAVPLLIGAHDKRLDYAKAVFAEPSTQKKISNKWIENIDANLPVLGLSQKAYVRRQQDHEDKITSLSLAQVKQRLETFGVVRDGNLLAVLKTAKINPHNKDNLRRFCTDLKLRGIDLDIIIAPIPDTTAALIAEHHPDTKDAGLQSFFEANVACAHSIVSQSLYDWGLDERHYINRFLKDDYPYEIWETPDEFEGFYENWHKRSKAHFYSPDHMNPVGAVIFSEKVGAIIRG